MHSEALCVCVPSVTAFSMDFGHRVSGSTDIIPCFLCLQVADLQNKASFLRYDNISLYTSKALVSAYDSYK